MKEKIQKLLGLRDMKIKFVKAPWFRGEPLQWNSIRFNGGDVYSVYRFGPILLQVRK
jgi:hypothetical protein